MMEQRENLNTMYNSKINRIFNPFRNIENKVRKVGKCRRIENSNAKS